MTRVLFLLFLNLGILLATFLPSLPRWEILVCALLAIALLGAIRLPSGMLSIGRVMLLALILGGIWSTGWGIWQLRYVLPDAWQRQDLQAIGSVVSLPQTDSRRVRFEFAIQKIWDPDGVLVPSSPIKKVQLSWYHPPADVEIGPGQQWRLVLRVRRPHSFMNPGGFDYEAFLFQRGIQAQGYVRGTPVLLGTDGVYPITKLRQSIKSRFAQLAISPQARGTFNALLIGDRSDLAPTTRRLLQRNGISHLIAISGLHLTMVGGMLFLLLLPLLNRCYRPGSALAAFPPLRCAAALVLPLLWCYAFLAGFSLPTQRALLMFTVFLGTILFGRFYRLLTVYLVAMTLVLLVNPLAALTAGFYLSFAAAGLILLIGSKLVRKQSTAHLGLRFRDYLLSLVLLQIALGLFLAPIVLFFFYEFSLAGFVVNLIAIPLTTFILMPWLFVNTALLFCVPDLIEPSFQFLAAAIDLCYTGLAFLAARSWSWVQLPQPSLLALLAAGCGVLVWVCRRRAADVVLAVLFFIPLLLPVEHAPATGQLRVTFLDVGQGLAVHLRTARHQLIYDTGAAYSAGASAGTLVLLPYLRQQGRTDLDRVIVSHLDKDHSGGLADLLDQVHVDSLMLNFAIQTTIPVLPCRAGASWTWDGVHFEIIHPSTTYRNRNDGSCVLSVTAGPHHLLLTGDVTAKAERDFMPALQHLPVDILQVPHHGSADASSPLLVYRTQPRYAVFAAGHLNYYKHPDQDVLQRYRQVASHPIILWRSGAVRFELGGKKIIYNKGYRLMNKRYWHRNYN